MTLSTTPPNTVAELVSFLSNAVADVNSLWALYSSGAWVVSYKDEVIASDSIVASDVPIEVLALTAGGAQDLAELTGGRKGMIKIIVFDDANITVKHDPSKIILKGGADLDPVAGDVLVLVNRDGDPDATPAAVDGYWREILRNLF